MAFYMKSGRFWGKNGPIQSYSYPSWPAMPVQSYTYPSWRSLATDPFGVPTVNGIKRVKAQVDVNRPRFWTSNFLFL